MIDEAHQILGTKLPSLSRLIRMSRSKGGVVMLVSQSPDDFSGEDDEFLDNMGLVAAFATNAKPGAAARVLGKGANLTNLQTGQCFVRLDKTTKKIKAPRIALAGADDQPLEEPGSTLTVAGWGLDAYQVGSVQDRLKELDVRVTTDLECQTNSLLGYSPDTEVCAAELLGDSCQGDSGGPIFGNRENGKVVQVGVVSYGLGCAVPLFPGVYAELNAPSIIDWVRATMKAGKKAGR